MQRYDDVQRAKKALSKSLVATRLLAAVVPRFAIYARQRLRIIPIFVKHRIAIIKRTAKSVHYIRMLRRTMNVRCERRVSPQQRK